MKIDQVVDAEWVLIRLSGRFDYTTHTRFLAQAETSIEQAGCAELRIDFDQVEYVDSSALGMLLMLRDKARKEGKTVSLSNVHGYVRQVIDNAQFNRLFDIH